MRNVLSVLALAAQRTFGRVLALTAAVGAVQAFSFAYAFSGRRQAALEDVLQKAHPGIPCLIGFFLLCAAAAAGGCGRGSKTRYTLGRLPLSERTVTLWWALYNACCFAFYWLAEAMILRVLCLAYGRIADGSFFGPQTVLLAFYRVRLLHSLLPLEETVRYVQNLALCLMMGLTSAGYAFRYRHGRGDSLLILTALFTAAVFCRGMESGAVSLAVMAGALVFGALAVGQIWGDDKDER